MNVVYRDEPIQKVYHELFDEAVNRYNAKQKRKDRCINDYYEHLRTGKQEKLFHELIVQIGNKDDMGVLTENGALAKELLDEYASPELRSKKQLIETFIAGVNDVDDVMAEWNTFVSEQREKELARIIQEEKLKEPETRKYLANAFRDGEIKTVGTDIDKLMPPVSRFGGGGRAQKKQGVIDKLKSFFDKFFGIGGNNFNEKD